MNSTTASTTKQATGSHPARLAKLGGLVSSEVPLARQVRSLMSVTKYVVALASAVTLLGAGVAHGSQLVGSTSADPVEDLTFQMLVDGNADHKGGVLGKVKPAGGRACAPNYDADEGTPVWRYNFVFGFDDTENDAPGPFSYSANYNVGDSGNYLLCTWLYEENKDDGDAYVTLTHSHPFVVRPPRTTVSIQSRNQVRRGRTLPVALVLGAEAERSLYVDLVRGRCAANAEANDNAEERVVSGEEVTPGDATLKVNVKPARPGTYRLCAYAQEGFGDTSPETVVERAVRVVERKRKRRR